MNIGGCMNVEKIPTGPEGKVPEELYVVIEVPKGSQNKYELDKDTGAIFLDRVLFTSMHYPANYGFVPKTLCDDGDPLDCLVLSSLPIHPGVVVRVRPIGLLIMEDEKGKDEKLLAVPVEKIDPRFANIKDIDDVPEAIKSEIKHFFEHYKDLEPGKWVKVKEWKNKEEAIEYVKKYMEKYQKEH